MPRRRVLHRKRFAQQRRQPFRQLLHGQGGFAAEVVGPAGQRQHPVHGFGHLAQIGDTPVLPGAESHRALRPQNVQKIVGFGGAQVVHPFGAQHHRLRQDFQHPLFHLQLVAGIHVSRGRHFFGIRPRLFAAAVHLIGAETNQLSVPCGLGEPEGELHIRPIGGLRVGLTGPDIGDGRRVDDGLRAALLHDASDILLRGIAQ